MKNLSKEELVKLYEAHDEEILKKLGIYSEAQKAYEEKREFERVKESRIKKAMALVKEAQELLSIYRLEIRITPARGIQVLGENSEKTFHADSKRERKITSGLKTPQFEYRIPILEVLRERGGRGVANEVLKGVYEKMKDILQPGDLESISSGTEIQWRNSARWERNNMKELGLLERKSPRGIWEITEKGRNYLEEHLNGDNK
jgi:restriction system protein